MPSRQNNRRPQHKESHISSPPIKTLLKPKPQTIFSNVRTGWPKSAFTFTHCLTPRESYKCYFRDIDDKIYILHNLYYHNISLDNFDYGPILELDASEKPHPQMGRNLKNLPSSALRNSCTQCPSSPIPFPTRRALARHRETVHRCPSCHWEFSTLEDRLNHIHAHHTPSTFSKPAQFPFNCCGQVFTQFSDPTLERHRWKCHATSQKNAPTPSLPLKGKGYRCRFLVCPRANQGYMRTEELDEHILEEHAICRTCDKAFKDTKALEQHLRQSPRHVEQEEMRCLECENSFGSYTELAEHTCWIPCQRGENRTCFFEVKSKQQLYEHQRKRKHGPFQKEEKERAVKCPGCTKTFKSAGGVLAHLESGSCDSGINRRFVEMAVQRFDTAGLVHDGEKLKEVLRIEGERMDKGLLSDSKKLGTEVTWPCQECGRVFTKKDALRMHLESPVHRKKAFHCPGEDGLPVNNMQKVSEERRNTVRIENIDDEANGNGGLDDRGVIIYEHWYSDNTTMAIEGSLTETSSSHHRLHRRFKTLSSLATHIEASEYSSKPAYGSRLLLAAIERVADWMEAMSTETNGEVILVRESAI